MKTLYTTIFALVAYAATASAITVTTPTNGAQLTSPFTLVASTTTCDSVPAVSMGYSLDYGSTTVETTSFSTLVLAGAGQHILHVKCWGAKGAAGDTDLNITIVSSPTTPPGNATIVNGIQNLSGWAWNYDPGTNGSASGTSSLVSSPSLSGSARQFGVNFTNYGGEIYHTTFGSDTAATHFIYDAQVWLADPSTVANVEMDMNQVIANGDTVIYGFQCDGWSGTWDYTVNTGTPQNPVDEWVHTSVSCPEPRTWTANTWHHIQVAYSRDSLGNVTYQSVVLDGNQSEFTGAKGNAAFALGWGPVLLTNFQLDGYGSVGSITAYLDDVSISRW